MSHFNICPDCIHRNSCEFDAFKPNQPTLQQVKQPDQELVLV